MTSDEARHTPDRPFTMAQPSLPMPLLYMCTHKGVRLGGYFRGNVPMRCPKCQRELKGTT
jgi:hypothetical protein